MTANANQIEYWNADQGRHWVEFQDGYDRMLAPYADGLLAGAAIGSDERVLDVGCGTGATTLRAAAAASTGEALGLDLSRDMIEQARRRAKDDGVSNVRFDVADAQVVALDPGSRDVAISRFGVMFFDDPTAAFANLASGLRADGRLAVVCWQGLAQNEWMRVPLAAFAEVLPLPAPPEPGAPGPFALSDPYHVRRVLGDAGFRAVELDPLVDSVLLGGGGSLDDILEWLQGTGFARTQLAEAEPETRARALDAILTALAAHEGPDGVRLGGAAWLVRARR
jgi:SAM-dependent methyltransferase